MRKILPIEIKGEVNDPGPAPTILFLEPKQLVVNDEYQRELSASSIRLIQRLALNWSWESFKAPNVAKTEEKDLYEIIDGQHTAIAAATNGNIPFLPCLLSNATILSDKAKGFLGINTNRLALSKTAIYNAQLAAMDETAISAQVAMNATKVNLLHFPAPNNKYKVGDTLAVGTLMKLSKKHGVGKLTLLLRLAVEAKAAPVSSMLLTALDLILPYPCKEEYSNRVLVVLRGQGVSRLEIIAKSRTNRGCRNYETFADMLADLAKLPARRMGK